MTLEDTHRVSARGDQSAARQPRDAGTDDRDIDFLH
jgi:hypothetical protein